MFYFPVTIGDPFNKNEVRIPLTGFRSRTINTKEVNILFPGCR